MTNLPNNLWKSPAIKERLMFEACFESNKGRPQKAFFWVLVPQADTKDEPVLLKNFEPSIQDTEPHDMQKGFARDIYDNLMKEVAYDGLWLVGWTHPPTSYEALTDTNNCWGRMIMIWHDKDGDPQYTLEDDMPFIKMLQDGVASYIDLAVQAHDQWREMYGNDVMKEQMALTEDQQKRVVLEALKDI